MDPKKQGPRSNDSGSKAPDFSADATIGGGATTQPSPGATPAERQLGPYRILEQLGQGGMGAVFKAEQLEPVRRIVAIKRIKPGFDTAAVIARFESERQALARMDHPHIAKVLDAGTDKFGRPYFVMEYVPGVPIVEFADKNRLSIVQRLELFLQICDAISHAHTKAIIHRDIKSTNVLAYMADGKPFVKVIDFGVAKALSGEKLTDRTLNTQMGAVIGTYGYMSPEQASGSADIDTRTDVYSLGVLLYEFLAGVQPFDGKMLRQAAAEELNRIIREEEPPRPSTKLSSLGNAAETVAKARQMSAQSLRHELTSELDWIPLMALRKERERRYASAMELAADIQNYLEHRPLKARPDSLTYRSRKMVRRNRTALLTTAGCVVFALVMVALVTWRIGVEKARVSEERGRKEAAEVLAQKQSDRLKGFQDALAQTRERAKELGQRAAQAQDAIDKADSEFALGAMEIRAERLTMDADAALTEAQSLDAAFRGAQRLADSLDGKAPTTQPSNPSRWTAFLDVKYGFSGFPNPTPLPGVEFWGIDLRHPRAATTCVALSPDGKTVVTSGEDLQVRRWDAKEGRQISCYFNHFAAVLDVGYSPDGKLIASAGEDGAVRVWQASTGRIIQKLEGHKSPILSLSWAPDSKRLASGSLDQSLRIWDTDSGKSIHVLNNNAARVGSVQWSPDGSKLASFGSDAKVRLWDPATGEQLYEIPDLEGQPVWNRPLYLKVGLAWSPDGRTVAWGRPGRIRLWNAQERQEREPIMLESLGHAAARLTWSPDGKSLASIDGSLAIYDVETRTLREKLLGGKAGITASAWAPDSKSIVIAEGLGDVRLWNLELRSDTWTVPGNPACPRSAAWAPDGSAIATGSPDDGIVIRDGNDLHVIRHFGHVKTQTTAMDWSPDGKQLAYRSRASDEVVVLNVETGERVTKATIDAQNSLGKIAWSPDGKTLALPAKRGTFCLWRPAEPGSPLMLGEGGEPVTRFAWSPDSKYVAVAGDSPDLEIWDTTTKMRARVLSGHSGRLTAIAWAPSGKLLASGSVDRTICLWDPAVTRVVDVLRGHRDRVSSLHWSGDSKELLSTGSAGSFRTWQVQWGALKTVGQAPFFRAEYTRDGSRAAISFLILAVLDVKEKACIDHVLPLPGGKSIFLGPRGHIDAPPGIEREIVYLIRTKDGQEMLSPEEFSARFNWKNDPSQAHRAAWLQQPLSK